MSGVAAGPAHAQQIVEVVQEGAIQLETGGGGTNVEVDDSHNQGTGDDSEYESGESTATTSVTSSIFSFTYANGRRYHSDRFKNQYFLPNDESEQDRLDLYHHIFLSLLGGKLYTAPLDNPQKVLDVGTGTGIWAIDFADENPQAEVIGPDISPIQPSWVPPNCKFEVDDMEEEWTYKDNYFDFIHMRSMSGSFKDWPKVLKQAYMKLKPGGYIEFQDYGCECFLTDGTKLMEPSDEHPLATYGYHVIEASKALGRPVIFAPFAKKALEDAGFVDVVEKTAIWPIGDWPKDKRLKEIGRWGREGVYETLYPFGVHLLTKTGWTVEQVKELCDAVKKSLQKSNQKGNVGKYYFQGWFVYGRKPSDSDVKK